MNHDRGLLDNHRSLTGEPRGLANNDPGLWWRVDVNGRSVHGYNRWGVPHNVSGGCVVMVPIDGVADDRYSRNSGKDFANDGPFFIPGIELVGC